MKSDYIVNQERRILTIRKRVALTIAGLDPSGGAGVIADVLTFSSIGLHPCVIITTLTIQDTKGVYKVKPISSSFLEMQLRKILEDIKVDAIKIGVLYTKENVMTIFKVLKEVKIPIVLDPLIRASNGTPLLEENAINTLKKLISIAKVVTPNRYEAEILSGIKIRSIEDCLKAAKIISELGSEAVIIKGGHLEEEKAIDLLYYRGETLRLEAERLPYNLHGAGCVFSSAVAGFLALGLDIIEAFKKAKELISNSIKHSLRIGKGRLIPSPYSY